MIDLMKIEEPTAAERRLFDVQNFGQRISLGDGELPKSPTPDCEVRATTLMKILRNPKLVEFVQSGGLRVKGAFISGTLDMQGGDLPFDLSFSNCFFERDISFVNARLRGVYFSGCRLIGLAADQAHFEGPLFVRGHTVFHGELALPSATILGDLQICNVRFDGDMPASIFANGLTVQGSVFLGDFPYAAADGNLIASAPIYMMSARIGRDFYLKNASLRAHGDLQKNYQPEDSDQSVSSAFSLARSAIGGLLYAKSLQVSGGIVNFSGVTAKRLNDEPNAEDATYRLRLDGFEYQSFAQHTDVSVKARLAWLARRPSDIGFSAQPYAHLARLYDELGHRDDADRVRIAKEDLQRSDDIQILLQRGAWGRAALLRVLQVTLKWLIGYGYRPVYAFAWMIALIVITGLFFQKTWDVGDMTPNSAPILVSNGWAEALAADAQHPGRHWSDINRPGQDYETFNAFAYSADLLIPIVNFGQEDAWAPSTNRSWWGKQGWWIRWVAKSIGWVFTALGAAGISGVIRR
ncbi:MAG: pentapeptide repeat-containing protein [Pseudomonadota bacterium]